MSLLSWLSRQKPANPQADSSGPSRTIPDRLPVAVRDPGNRKSERNARRELLYSVVRESMARAGVLSANYRFKVLSLDGGGRQFLVMVDLASSERADADLQVDIETAITHRAKKRHDLTVSAVYWRRNDQVGVGGQPTAPQQLTGVAETAPSRPAELNSVPPTLPPDDPGGRGPAGYDPIDENEMEALRRALANGLGPGVESRPRSDAGASRPVAARRAEPPAPGKHQKNYALLTGFEDTELREQEQRTRTLSPTQSGDLN